MLGEMPALIEAQVNPATILQHHHFGSHDRQRFQTSPCADRLRPVVVARYGESVLAIDGQQGFDAIPDRDAPFNVLECDGDKFDQFAEEVGLPQAFRLIGMQARLIEAERFIAGFENDDTQEGVDELLHRIRLALPAVIDEI